MLYSFSTEFFWHQHYIDGNWWVSLHPVSCSICLLVYVCVHILWFSYQWLCNVTRDIVIYDLLLFGYLRSYEFHIHFVTVFFSSVEKNGFDVLMWIVLYMWFPFSNIAIFDKICQSTCMWLHPSSVFNFFHCCVVVAFFSSYVYLSQPWMCLSLSIFFYFWLSYEFTLFWEHFQKQNYHMIHVYPSSIYHSSLNQFSREMLVHPCLVLHKWMTNKNMEPILSEIVFRHEEKSKQWHLQGNEWIWKSLCYKKVGQIQKDKCWIYLLICGT